MLLLQLLPMNEFHAKKESRHRPPGESKRKYQSNGRVKHVLGGQCKFVRGDSQKYDIRKHFNPLLPSEPCGPRLAKTSILEGIIKICLMSVATMSR